MIALAAVMATAASGNDQLLFGKEEPSIQLVDKFDLNKYNLNAQQKKEMQNWKDKIPVIFENKNYRLTWGEFWKAEKAQEVSKGLSDLDLQTVKD